MPLPLLLARRTFRADRIARLSVALLIAACADESPLAQAPRAASGSGGAAGSAAAEVPGLTEVGAGGNTLGSAGEGQGVPTELDCTRAGNPCDASGAGAAGALSEAADAAAPSDAVADAGSGISPDGAAPDATPPHSPCPSDGSPCVIMPFGDSITEGFPAFNGGYRVELFRQALLDGHSITFVGARANGPGSVDGQPFPTGHEGYSGFTIDPSTRSGISPRAEPAIIAFRPHIILLMIGTNDIDLNIDVASAPTRLGALIDRITSAAPDLLLVVGHIIPTTNAATNERIRAYNAAIPELVESRRAAGKHVVGLDTFAAFADNPNFATEYMVDSLHPNDAGYAVLGQRWYQTIEPLLP